MLAARYYEAVEAPQDKELVWFEDSAHLTYAEEPEMDPIRRCCGFFMQPTPREGGFLWTNG